MHKPKQKTNNSANLVEQNREPNALVADVYRDAVEDGHQLRIANHDGIEGHDLEDRLQKQALDREICCQNKTQSRSEHELVCT